MVGFWHSKLSKNEKQIILEQIKNDEIKIMVGARSCLFVPFQKLGIIVVDEEHDSSYKQQDNIRYQARDLAVVRTKIEKNFIIIVKKKELNYILELEVWIML